jgi:hypothetical protein
VAITDDNRPRAAMVEAGLKWVIALPLVTLRCAAAQKVA